LNLQAGPPLNYFIYPYVEMDSKAFRQVSKKFTYRDAVAGPTTRGAKKQAARQMMTLGTGRKRFFIAIWP